MLKYQNSFFSPHFRTNKVAYMFWMLRQGYRHRYNFIIIPYSDNILEILKILYKFGFISGLQVTQTSIKIFLKWSVDGDGGMQSIKTYTKPSHIHRLTFKNFIVSHIRSCAVTPLWIFKTKLGYTDHYSLYKNKIGGELLAIIK